MLSAFWGDPPDHHTAPKKGIGKVLDKFNHWFDHQAARYGKVIAWALDHRRSMAAIALASFVAAIALQVTVGGTSFMPKQDHGALRVDVRTPSSSSLAYTRGKMEKVSAIAMGIKEVKSTEVYINQASGNIWVDIGERRERKRSATEIGSELRQKLAGMVGGEFTVIDDFGGGGGGKAVQIDFVGPDSRKLMDITNDFMAKLRQVPGAVDVGLSEQDPKDELQIELNRGLANSMGISAGDAASSLRVAFAGVEVGDWVDPTGEARDVAVRLHPDDRLSLEHIERLPIKVGGSNQMVPLDQIAKVTMGKGPAGIRHKNGLRTIAVTANVEGRAAGEVLADAMKIAKNIDYPPGFGQGVGGASKNQGEIFSAMGIGLLSGIGLMYLVLVMQFGSFTAPGGVMLSLPLSLIGVVVGLIVTGGTLNLMSLIGVIMLMGLVAKNAILLLDAARKREQEGASRHQALIEAGQTRLRPILMTTFALIAGMMPVAIGMGNGGEFYRPMAVAIIGGTLTSTLLTLLVVPTFYDSIEITKDSMIAKFHRREERWGAALAFLMTFFEAILALVFVRLVFRLLMKAVGLVNGRRAPKMA
jgi:multidrug efflux pump subunit AcrB